MVRKLTLYKGLCYNSRGLGDRLAGRGNSSVVEHNLAKVGVAGSNPVSRSISSSRDGGSPRPGLPGEVRRRSQVVKAEVCKTSIQRFESARRLHARRTAVAGPGWRNWETQRT